MAHIRERAESGYCSQAEYIRQLIVADKRKTDAADIDI